MKSIKLSNEAVSPVVGVMLMLVITIIIAAVVSGFAGSMTSSIKITPQATITAEYSQANGMMITHAGGDALPLSEIKFSTMPSEIMGADYENFFYEIGREAINYSAGSGGSTAIMNNATGYYYKSAFMPGDVLTISQDMCKDRPITDEEYTALAAANNKNTAYRDYGVVNTNAAVFWGAGDLRYPNSITEKGRYFSAYQFMNPENIGKYFYLIVSDDAGNTISKQKVTIRG